MKIINLQRLRLAVLCLLIATACQKEETDIIITDQSTTLIFKGLHVNHMYDTPTSVFTYELTDFQAFLWQNKSPRAKSLSKEMYPSLTELSDIVDTQVHKYPDTDRMNEQDIALIRQHFSLSELQIAEHITIIEEYYIRNMQYDILQSLIAHSKLHGTSYTRSQYYSGLCDDEFWVLFGRLKAIDAVEDASNQAIAFTNQLYPGVSHHQNPADAFRHTIWNALIAKYFAQKKHDISKGIELARDFTTAHEDCNADDGSPDYDIAMDLHNNEIGRRYFNSVASTKKRRGLFRRDEVVAPSDEEMRDALKSRVDNGAQVAKETASVNSISVDQPVYF